MAKANVRQARSPTLTLSHLLNNILLEYLYEKRLLYIRLYA